MADTDRVLLKKQQIGQFQAQNAASDPLAAVNSAHSRQRDIYKVGTENAATNVAESAACIVERKSWLKSARLLTGTNVATDNTDYVTVTIYKRTSAGATQTALASWNTHGGAQAAITRYVSSNMALGTGSNMIIAAGSVITYTVVKTGAGKALGGDTVFTLDLEEV